MKTILVIEDEAPLLKNISELLSYEGFEVISAPNGLQGIQWAREQLPDLVICDVMMPDIDGFEVLQELHRDSITATIPFIFLTAKTERVDMRKGMELGADDYITKPFVGNELVTAVRIRLERQAAIQNQRLRAISSRLVHLQETERRQIAAALQGEIAPSLAGVKAILAMSKRFPEDMIHSRLEEIRLLVEEVIRRIEEVSFELRPAMLDDLGLLPTLLYSFRRYTDTTQVQVIFKHMGLETRFPSEIETTVFRIVQGVLSNTARHSGADHVIVQIWVDGEILGIQIEDQGIGFDIGTLANPGMSGELNELYERTTLLGGQFVVVSTQDAGTQITAHLPIGALPAELDAHPTAIGNKPATVVQPMGAGIRIALADNHELVVQGLRRVLEEVVEFTIVGEASVGEEALVLVEQLHPMVLIMSLELGWAVIEQIAKSFPQTRVLVLSAHSNEAYALEALRKGAAGYALMEMDSEDLVQAVREVAVGRRYLSPTLSERAFSYYLDAQQPEAALLPQQDLLTSREVEVLEMIVQGLKNQEIAEQLVISPRTVETHRANLMRKLGMHTQVDLIRYALQHGLAT